MLSVCIKCINKIKFSHKRLNLHELRDWPVANLNIKSDIFKPF